MKKICVISPLGYSGIAYYDFSLCYFLSRIGLNVDLLSTKKYIVIKTPNFTRKEVFINTYGDIGRLIKGVNYVLALCRAYVIVLTNGYKTVHLQKLELPPIDSIFILLLKIIGIKLIYTPHDILPFKESENKSIIALNYRLVHKIIVHNKANKNDLVKYFKLSPDKICVIPHGNFNLFIREEYNSVIARKKIGLPADRKILLFFGSIRKGKGLDILLDAYSELVKKHPDLLLVIAGKKQREFDLESLLKKMDKDVLANNIILRDEFVPDNEIQYYYEAADLVVIPYGRVSESGVLKYAFSCSSPTVVSDIDEFINDVEDGVNAIVFKHGDPHELVLKIGCALAGDYDLTALGRAAKKYSDTHWDWEKIAYLTKKCYESIV